jgi:hypothetical protein
MDRNLIGLSLSLCIKDIFEKDVDLDRVKWIIAATKMEDEGDYKEVYKEYAESYWSRYPLQARFIFFKLLDEQKIIQPRLEGLPPCNIAGGHWLEITPKTF